MKTTQPPGTHKLRLKVPPITMDDSLFVRLTETTCRYRTDK